MAILIREDKLWVVEERHENDAMKPCFYGLGRVETHVPGFGRLDIAVTHLALSMRVLEAEAFHLLGKTPMIAGGDLNAAYAFGYGALGVAQTEDDGPAWFRELDPRVGCGMTTFTVHGACDVGGECGLGACSTEVGSPPDRAERGGR